MLHIRHQIHILPIILVVFVFTAAAIASNKTIRDDDGGSSSNKISIRFYGEAQCPFCRKFVTEVWQPIWTDSELRNFIDYDFVPWGNAYFATKECGSGPYNAQERGCWYQKCIDTTNDDGECFAGDVVYQHGIKEGQTDIYESCVKDLLGLEVAVEFTYCAEGKNMDDKSIVDAEALMNKCLSAKKDIDKIQDCYEKRGRDIEISNAKQTPTHPGVPYVVVDGSPVDDFLQTKEIICKRLEEKGGVNPLPKVCHDTTTTTTATTTTSHIRFNMDRPREISLS